MINSLIKNIFAAGFDPKNLMQPPEPLNPYYSSNGLTPGAILLILIGIRNFILFVGVVLIVIFIVIAAIKFMGSGGDEKKVEEAKKSLKYALIGAAITLAAFAILQTSVGLLRNASQQFNPIF